LLASIDRAGAYHAVSDQRMKTDAQLLRYGLKEVMALKPMEYDLHLGNCFEKGDLVLGKQSVHKIGFFAQDVYHLIPEAVTKPNDEKSDLYTMDYTALLPPLVNAIQEVTGTRGERNQTGGQIACSNYGDSDALFRGTLPG
jgi:hypothetical protein